MGFPRIFYELVSRSVCRTLRSLAFPEKREFGYDFTFGSDKFSILANRIDLLKFKICFYLRSTIESSSRILRTENSGPEWSHFLAKPFRRLDWLGPRSPVSSHGIIRDRFTYRSLHGGLGLYCSCNPIAYVNWSGSVS